MLLLKSRRKKTYVNARVQGRIAGRVALYWVLYHFVLWHGLFVYRYAQVQTWANSGQRSAPFRELYWQFFIDYLPLLLCASLILPLFIVDFVRLTHRVVGPILRVNEALQQLMEGRRVPHVEFRRGDLLKEFEAEFNKFLAYYDAQRSARAAATFHGSSNGGPAVMSDSDARRLQSIVGDGAPAEREPASPAAECTTTV